MATRSAPFLRRVWVDAPPVADGEAPAYPFSIPAIATLGELDFAPITVLAGDNGTGKSTLIEAIAVATGFNAEGGGRNLVFETHPTHSDLADHLQVRFRRRPAWGWFLRAETFYGMATRIATDGELRAAMPDLHGRSHGESFLTLVEDRCAAAGLYLMDEPESALSLHGQLRLLSLMAAAVERGAQFVVATHSPLLMRAPGAAIWSFDGGTVGRAAWHELESVVLWRRFLESPDAFVAALLDDG